MQLMQGLKKGDIATVKKYNELIKTADYISDGSPVFDSCHFPEVMKKFCGKKVIFLGESENRILVRFLDSELERINNYSWVYQMISYEPELKRLSPPKKAVFVKDLI